MPRSATQETWGRLDDQAHDGAVSEPVIGTMGGSFREASVDWVRWIGATLRACDPCLTARRTMGFTTLGATSANRERSLFIISYLRL